MASKRPRNSVGVESFEDSVDCECFEGSHGSDGSKSSVAGADDVEDFVDFQVLEERQRNWIGSSAGVEPVHLNAVHQSLQNCCVLDRKIRGCVGSFGNCIAVTTNGSTETNKCAESGEW